MPTANAVGLYTGRSNIDMTSKTTWRLAISPSTNSIIDSMMHIVL